MIHEQIRAERNIWRFDIFYCWLNQLDSICHMLLQISYWYIAVSTIRIWQHLTVFEINLISLYTCEWNSGAICMRFYSSCNLTILRHIFRKKVFPSLFNPLLITS